MNRFSFFFLILVFRHQTERNSGGPPSKGWKAQMEEHWYGNSEVSGSSPGPVKVLFA